ncbi:DNA polymerase III sliding clamp (beta) subunit (PCNA family) [Lysinibacillus parviboronicapiens]|uniref:DNA polymerase III sliding clamp (Beta) subunit (PCNA family) n=1 Tax=Lysinibacillus parviboronicapiens TaxID=436516 RepID=A0ABV2PQW6_9BACI
MKFTFSNDSIELSVPGIHLKLDGFEFDINQHKEAENTLSFTPGYLLDALEAFIKFSSDDNITVHHQGALRIFIFENEEMTIGVLPRRFC